MAYFVNSSIAYSQCFLCDTEVHTLDNIWCNCLSRKKRFAWKVIINVTSSYSTWLFCRGVSGFATDCPCGVWCRGLTTCLLHVGPPFGNRILNNRLDIMDNESYFFVFWHMQLHMYWYIRSFFGFTFLNILDFFKYSCTNIFHRRSLYTFYQWGRYAANQDSSYCVIYNHISWIQGLLPVFHISYNTNSLEILIYFCQLTLNGEE